MALTLTITKEIPHSLIETIIAMDHDAYPPEDQMTRDRAFMIYGLIRDSLILLKDGGQLIGFLSIYGVRPDLAPLAVARRQPIFAVEEREHLIPILSGPADGYLHNIILNPECRGKGYRRYLYQGLKYWLNSHTGIERIWADAVSAHGERALAALGLAPCPLLHGLWGGDIQSVHGSLDRQLAKNGSEPRIAFL